MHEQENQNSVTGSAQQDYQLINGRYKIDGQIEYDGPFKIYRGTDTKSGKPLLLIKTKHIPQKDHAVLLSKPIEASFRDTCFIFPSEIIDSGNDTLLLYEIPTGITLTQNLEFVKGERQSFHHDEIVRIGSILCKAEEFALENNFIVLFSLDTIFCTIHDTLSMIAIGCGANLLQDAADKIHSNAPHQIIKSLYKMAAIDPQQDNCERPWVKEKHCHAISKLQREDLAKLSIDKLRHILESSPLRSFRKRVLIRNLCYIFFVIIMIFTLHHFRPAGTNSNFDTEDIAKEATEDIRSKAISSSKSWSLLAAKNNIMPIVQSLDGQEQIKIGDEYRLENNHQKARLAYDQACLLFEAAISIAEDNIRLKKESQNSRQLAILSQSRWQSLIGSDYIALPESVKRAIDAMLEGDFNFLKSHYDESVIAYGLAGQLFNSVSLNEYNRLYDRHDAKISQQSAILSATTWGKLEDSLGLSGYEAADNAKNKMVLADNFLKAEKDSEAAALFHEVSNLFDEVTKTVIQEMVSRQATLNAQENAARASHKWVLLSKAMKISEKPESILKADSLYAKALVLSQEGKHESAQENYNHVAYLYEFENNELNSKVHYRAQACLEQADILRASLENTKTELDKRLKDAQKDFELIYTKLNQSRESIEHKKLQAQSQAIRNKYKLLIDLNTHCQAKVFDSIRFQKASNNYHQGLEQIGEKDFIAANMTLQMAIDDFIDLSNMPSAIERYLILEDKALQAKEEAYNVLGPIAEELEEIQKILALGEQSLSNAGQRLDQNDIAESEPLLEDAELAFQTAIQQAESELLVHAKIADSEFRKQRSLAIIEELLTMNAYNQEAIQLKDQLLSLEEPSHRITLIQNQLRIDGKTLPAFPTEEQLSVIFGKPSRYTAGKAGLLFDDYGIQAIIDPSIDRIYNIIIFYAKPRFDNQPVDFYKGTIELEGHSIPREGSIETINELFTNHEFTPSQISGSYEVRTDETKVLIRYFENSSRISSISLIFIRPEEQLNL